MTHPDAFLRAILESPDDDGLRLAYADHLEERGDPRGEFIRVQCALAKTPRWLPTECDVCGNTADADGSVEHGRGCYVVSADGGGSTAADENPLWEELSRRARELLERHRGSWTAGMAPGLVIDAWSLDEPMVPYAYGARARFRRGFVESVECTAAAFLTHADALTAAAPIREVRLTTWPEAERVGTSRGYTPYGRPRKGRFRLPGRRREMTSAMTAQEVGQTLLAAEWPRIAFTLPGRAEVQMQWAEIGLEEPDEVHIGDALVVADDGRLLRVARPGERPVARCSQRPSPEGRLIVRLEPPGL